MTARSGVRHRPGRLRHPVRRARALAGGDAAGNADIVHKTFAGASGPIRDIGSWNAAAALVVADLADDLGAGVDLARAILDDGRAVDTLDAFVRVSVAAREAGEA
jgi:anthranilate phosphoribosyltransferase